MIEKTIGKARLILEEGDITKATAQAIVNAANTRLAGGGGVDGAIHQAGGREIMAECRRIGHCPTGEAVITTAGVLPAEKVIHTVGPIYQGLPQDARLLASCYQNSLVLAKKHGLKTIAFPSISTGAYGYPLAEAASVALGAAKEFLEQFPDAMDEVRFVLFSETAYEKYKELLLSM